MEDLTGFISGEDGAGFTGTFSNKSFYGFKSRAFNPRVRGHAAFIRIYNYDVDEWFAVEEVRGKLSIPQSAKSRRST